MKAYVIKIELQNVESPVWRRIIIPAEIRFWRLHQTIQYAMGWKNYHPHEFNFPSQRLSVTNNDDECEYLGSDMEIRSSEKMKLGEILEQPGLMEYVYNFGDYWVHQLTLEEIRDDYPVGYPQILAGAGDCPPEDVGGPGGYAEFLKTLSNPKHKDHDFTKSWAESQWWKPFDLAHTNNLMREFLKMKKVK